MEKNQNNQSRKNSTDHQPNQKTNEDYNQRRPDPTDPNESKRDPNTKVPNIYDEEDVDDGASDGATHQTNTGRNKVDRDDENYTDDDTEEQYAVEEDPDDEMKDSTIV